MLEASFLPAISMAIWASWLIVTISSEPMFTGPVPSPSAAEHLPCIRRYKKDLVCSPSPQILDLPAVLGLGHFTAKGRRRLFPAAVPGTLRPEDIVEPRQCTFIP